MPHYDVRMTALQNDLQLHESLRTSANPLLYSTSVPIVDGMARANSASDLTHIYLYYGEGHTNIATRLRNMSWTHREGPRLRFIATHLLRISTHVRKRGGEKEGRKRYGLAGR